MSNIHRLRNDDELNNQRGSLRERLRGDPNEFRNENFCQFLKYTFCRRLRLVSFTGLATITIVLIYLICLFWGINFSPEKFLEPKANCPLMIALSKDAAKLRSGQVWRWLSYSLLHGDFVHVFTNMLVFLIFGSLLEALTKASVVAIVWVIAGILGGLFSSLIVNYSVTVGASCSIYGIIGAYVFYFIFLIFV